MARKGNRLPCLESTDYSSHSSLDPRLVSVWHIVFCLLFDKCSNKQRSSTCSKIEREREKKMSTPETNTNLAVTFRHSSVKDSSNREEKERSRLHHQRGKLYVCVCRTSRWKATVRERTIAPKHCEEKRKWAVMLTHTRAREASNTPLDEQLQRENNWFLPRHCSEQRDDRVWNQIYAVMIWKRLMDTSYCYS